MPSLCGVILAAGESSRMGSDKALLLWPPQHGQTFLARAIESLFPFNDMVLVVAGKNAARLAPIVYAAGAMLVENPHPEHGQFSSLQAGLREVLGRGRDAAMITLVDRPAPRRETVGRLRSAFEAAVQRGIWAVVPEYQGKHGHPIVIGREMIEAFLKAPEGATAREIEHQHQSLLEYVQVDDPLVTLNVDTPQDYSSLPSSIPQTK
ncbi:MAG: nucleotidyltransferase family protein [Acidobacteria bacterium]|nr:nucleotidyltransferase family protein [Acidobacteriota bacterium]